MTITHELAAFAARTRIADIPDDATAAAKVVLLDGIANAVAGSQEEVAQRVAEYTTKLGGVPDSTVIGRSERIPANSAAFANGVALHCLDYEVQGYPSAHGTSSIFPAIAAVGERQGASGPDIITAFVVGWDIQQRLRAGGEKGDMRGFHPPGIVGPIAAAAAVANLRHLGTADTAMAIGMAASRTGGLFGNNGTMTKATHPGNAARSGVESADLAAAGVTSNPDIILAKRGYSAAAFGGVFDVDLALDGLGQRFHLTNPGISIKPFPAEIYMQWPLDAMTQLKKRTGITLDDVADIILEPPVFRADLSRPEPITGLDGKFSYEYCVAAALVEDRVTIGTFTDAVRFSDAIVRALKKVTLRENPSIPHDKKTTWARVIVHTVDGRTLEETSSRYEGALGRAMPRESHLAKIEDCFTVGHLGDRFSAVVQLVDDLEEVADFSGLMHLLATN